MVSNDDKNKRPCPFHLGDTVTFDPDAQAYGWAWASFDRVRLHPGDVGTVSRIENGRYLYLDDERGGFHWECFKHSV